MVIPIIKIGVAILVKKKTVMGQVYEEMLFKKNKTDGEMILFNFLRNEIDKLNKAIKEIKNEGREKENA